MCRGTRSARALVVTLVAVGAAGLLAWGTTTPQPASHRSAHVGQPFEVADVHSIDHDHHTGDGSADMSLSPARRGRTTPSEGGCFIRNNCPPVPKDSNPAAVSKCVKMGLAAGGVAGAVAATITSPIDVPGITVTGIVSFLGTDYFCSIGWM